MADAHGRPARSSSRTRRRRCSRRRSTSAGYRVEGGRQRGRSRCSTSRPTAGPARSCAPTTIPKARSRCAARCASATRRSSRPAARLAARSCTTSSSATTSSTTSASRRSTRRSSRRGCGTCVPAPGAATRPELVEYGDLVLNLETYQAAIDGKPLDLTYMEYELLKFFAHAPGQGVHPRAAALAGVGLRVLRRRAHGRRPRPAAAGQARRGARQPDPDRALGRLPLRPVPLARRDRGRARSSSLGFGSPARASASSESSQP